MITTRVFILVLILSTTAAYAQSSGDSPSDQSPGSHQETEQPHDTGDFASPVQEILYYSNQAALHLTMLCLLSDDSVLAETLLLHNSVRQQVTDRSRLLVILAAAEQFTSAARHGQPHYVPDFFRDKDNLVALKERATRARELHRQVLVYAKAYRYRESTGGDTMRLADESPSLDEVGHPANFLDMETRRHLDSLGFSITDVRTTHGRHLERPSHLELGIGPFDKEFSRVIESLNLYRRLHLTESGKGYAASRRSDEALERVRKRQEQREKLAKTGLAK